MEPRDDHFETQWQRMMGVTSDKVEPEGAQPLSSVELARRFYRLGWNDGRDYECAKAEKNYDPWAR